MIARFAVRHPVSVAVLAAGAVLLGVLSLRDLPLDLLPDIEAPRIAVLVRSGDRSPAELEEAYARPLEGFLGTRPGVTALRTVTSVGRVLATVDFDWGTNLDVALVDIQSQVGPLAADRDVDSVVVRRFDPSADPVLVLALTDAAADDAHPGSLARLRRLADERVARVLERVPGVATVQVAGGRQQELRVSVEPHRLAAHGLSVERLSSLLAQGNAEASGGTIESGRQVLVIRGVGAYEKLEDVASLPLPGPAGSAPVRLSDVADVAWADAPVHGLVQVGNARPGTEAGGSPDDDPSAFSREGVTLSVYKEGGSNTVRVTRSVREALSDLDRELAGLEVTVVSDEAQFIEAAIAEVRSAALVGVLLAILVLAAFLRSLRAVVLVGVAIPLSIVTTFAAMGFAGLSLNLMTLGGLALGAGMLVDNAIVVLEAVFRRLEMGDTPAEAAERGTGEVTSAIVASTLTTLVVFLPVVFLHGLAADLFADLAFTVSCSLAASLVVALLVLPAAAARVLKAGSRGPAASQRWEARHERAVAAAIRRPGLVLGLALLVLAGTLAWAPRLPRELLPSSDAGQVTARLILPEGTRVEVTAEAASRLVEAVERTHPGVLAASAAELGEAVRDDGVLTEDVPTESTGVLRLRLRDARERGTTTQEVRRTLSLAAEQVAGLALDFEPADAVLGRLLKSGPPVAVEIHGQDLEALERASADLAERLSALPELFNVRSTFDDRRAEVRLDVDRVVAAALGLSPEVLARQLRQRLGAESATSFRVEGEERDVVIRASTRTLEALPSLELDAPRGERVRLGDLATVRVVSSPTRLLRSRGTRLGGVTAHLAPGASLASASVAVERTVAERPPGPGMRSALSGAETRRRESFAELTLAALLAIALVYMVMAAQFESLLHPFTILLTLPTAGLGVLLALRLGGHGFSLPALLGVVLLAGIAVNNGILLVSLAQTLWECGTDAASAAVQASGQRLRPILMTTATTVLGMLPLALGFGEGSDLRAPLALAVAGGLVTSTLLTLFVVPVAFTLLAGRQRPAAGS